MCYRPHAPSVLLLTTQEVVCAWHLRYLLQSCAALFLYIAGWSGIGYLMCLAFWIARLRRWCYVPISVYGVILLLSCVTAVWCAWIGYEPIAGVVPGGYVGTFLIMLIQQYTPHAWIDPLLTVCFWTCGILSLVLGWRRSRKKVHDTSLCVSRQQIAPESQNHRRKQGSKEADEQAQASHTSWKISANASRHAASDYAFQEVSYPHISTGDTHRFSTEPDDVALRQARELEAKLATFGIQGNVTDITRGPLVTLFAYHPDPSVKLANITAREDDLRLALQAVSLRIIAPIPGTSRVGFEVSRPQPDNVGLERLLACSDMYTSDIKLPLGFGTDAAGKAYLADLADMPHLLVAGSTGSGKSVALHTYLVTLLYRGHPDAMRLVLIDPKRLEFVQYQQLPHLATPIVFQATHVISTLSWLVQEMERRYDLLANAGVRHISEYHHTYGQAALPYIVVVVDELADLMMASGKEVEHYIARLAQMARAAGIHMIVATQRPSVDVLTGMIKVNFLARAAFKVTSKVDSRTIIDQPGAEKLLGRGDMLHLDARGTMHRLHGAYTSHEHITHIVEHWKKQLYHHAYLFDPHTQSQTSSSASAEDALYQNVRAFVQERETVSISLIQREFRIGYNRSARLVDALEQEGVVVSTDTQKTKRVVQ